MKRFSNVRRAGASEPLGGVWQDESARVVVESQSIADTIDDFTDDATVRDLKEHFHKRQKKLHPNRQRFATLNKTFFEEEEEEDGEENEEEQSSFKGEPLISDLEKLESHRDRVRDTILFKDLGPQISYQTVFSGSISGRC